MTAAQPATGPAAPRRKPVVVARGDTALRGRGAPAQVDVLRRNVATAVESIADVATDHDVVVAHGDELRGAMAHQLERGLADALPGREVTALRRHSVVDADELRTIRWLMAEGVLVICGRGGVPVVADAAVTVTKVAAVAAVDHDLSTALLAACLGAEALLMLTDVRAVERDWGTPQALPVRKATPDEMRRVAFADGSMGPKVHAACRFVEATGGLAAIGALADARALLNGRCVTIVQTTHGRLWADCEAARDRLSLVPDAIARSLDASAVGPLSV
jgi:carbamate kinase